MNQLLVLLSDGDSRLESLWVAVLDSFYCLLPCILMLFDVVAVVAVAVVTVAAISETLTVEFQAL